MATLTYLNRQEAAEHVRSQGFSLQPTTLAALAARGEGPPFSIFGRRAVYETIALDEWVAGQIHQPASKTKSKAEVAS